MAVSANQQDQLQIIPSITVGRQASFWNFARADYQAAYINRQRTLLDTEDIPLWRTCGLQIQPDGTLYTNPAEIKSEPLHCRQIAQLVAHTLLYLVLRTVNYLALDADTTAPRTRQTVWDSLHAQLDTWQTNLPETFQPCAQIRYPLPPSTQISSSTTASSPLTEVFFSITQCAAAIHLYHFARILLLLNKPDTTSTTTTSTTPTSNSTNNHNHNHNHNNAGITRLKAYREVSTAALQHARAILGIALGRPHPAVRVEMLLPLYVAGGCLEADAERRVVVELLRAIELDTGCATEGKVRNLIEEWGWEEGCMG